MATLPTERPVTPLRQQMLDDMARRSMGARTQHDYVRHVRAFAAFLGGSPDTATAEDVRRFQLYQREHGVGESVIGATVSDDPISSIALIQLHGPINHFILETLFTTEAAYQRYSGKAYVRSFRTAIYPHFGSSWDERSGSEIAN